MTFDPRKILKNKSPQKVELSQEQKELNEYVSSNEERYNLSPLLKNKEAYMNKDFKSLAEAENAIMEARKNALKVMNIVRYSSPILKIAFEKSKTDEERSQSFVEINERIYAYAKKTMKVWGLDYEDQSNKWVLNVLARVYSSGMTDEMLLNDEEIEKISNEIYRISEMNIEGRYDQSFFYPMTTSIKVAIIKAATPIYLSVNNHTFLKNKEVRDEDIKKIMTFIVNKSTHAIEDLAHDITEEKDKIMMFKVILEESSKIFSDIWDKQGRAFSYKYSSASQLEIKQLKEKNPNGIDILPYVFKKFDEIYSSMINLAKIA